MADSAIQDIRFAGRTLRKHPGFSITAALTLALGIGTTTAVFSVVNTLLLRPLPFPGADRLIVLQESVSKFSPTPMPVSAQDVPDFARLSHAFTSLGAFNDISMDLSGGGAEPERVNATRAAAGVFRALATTPLLGRTFTDNEDVAGHNVVILSHALWQSRFGADRQVIGTTVLLDRQPYTIIGVMPPQFEFPLGGMPYFSPARLWVPIAFTAAERDPAQRGDNFNIGVLARLRPGMTIAAANADVMGVAARIQEQFYPVQFRDRSQAALNASVTPLRDQVVGGTKQLVLIVFGAVGLLLLIACANVGNLALARGIDRQQEVAVRVALGAGRRRLVRQLLAETGVLGLVGGAIGLVIAYISTRVLVVLAAEILPRAQEITIDPTVLLFAAAASITAGLALGLVPAAATTGVGLGELIGRSGRSETGTRAQRATRDSLVAVQVGLALILLVSSGLLIRSFMRTRDTDPGFRPDNALALEITLPTTQYPTATSEQTFFDRLTSQVTALPGVVAIGMASDQPLSAGWTHLFTPEGHEGDQHGNVPRDVHTLVEGDYFRALGIPIVRGRGFDDAERRGARHVVMISEGMAKRYWPQEDPVGRRLKWGAASASNDWLTIVGVVGDVKQGPLDAPTLPHTYEPYRQFCHDEDVSLCSGRMVFLRTMSAPLQVASSVRTIIRQLDPQQPIGHVATVGEFVSTSLRPRQLNTFVIAALGLGALVLAAIGVYAVISYTVAQQRHELGLRLALGAQPTNVVKHVLASGLKPAAVGLGAGVVVSLIGTRLLASLLYDVSPTDPSTFAAVGILLILVAAGACWMPARRALKNDPATTLRSN